MSFAPPASAGGCNGGAAGGEREGVTHQFFEDLAIARSLPNMKVVSPADYQTWLIQQRQAIQAANAQVTQLRRELTASGNL